MKEYKIIKTKSWSSSAKAAKKMEIHINDMAVDGWQVVSVSFAHSPWGAHEAFATLEIEREMNDREFV